MGDAKKVVRIKESDFGKISVYVGLGEETVIIVEGDKLKNPEWKDEEGNKLEEIRYGQCLKLSVKCEDMPEGEDVIFHVFQKGDDITGAPKASVYGKAKNGVATSDVFRCPSMNEFTLSDEDIKLVFIAKADGYVTTKSKEITAKPIKLKNPKWKDEKGNEVTKVFVGDILKLSVEYDVVLEDGNVSFKIFYEGADTENDSPIIELQAQNKKGIAEISLDPSSNIFDLYIEKTGERTVNLIFTCKEADSETVQSSSVELKPRRLTKDEKNMIINTVGLSYRGGIFKLKLDDIGVVDKMPTPKEILAVAKHLKINIKKYTEDGVRDMLVGTPAMSLPNGVIYLPPYARGNDTIKQSALLVHEVDHQYTYQINAPKKVFTKLMKEAGMINDPYDFLAQAKVGSISDIKKLKQIPTLEGQAQYIENYVIALLDKGNPNDYKVFSKRRKL